MSFMVRKFYSGRFDLGIGVLLCAGLALLWAPTAGAVEKIALHALFKDKAIVLIDGRRAVLQAGVATDDGVKLVSTDTQEETAVVEVDGKPQTLRLGVVVSSFVSGGKGSVTLYPGRGGHYFADGTINGQGVQFMVDTGATSIALNTSVAQRLGIDYRKSGQAGYGSTAGGFVRTYQIKLDKVQVGDIVQYGVDAAVIEGAGPSDVLLGMSFLGRCDMKRDGEKLELIQRY
jgi:aspartyl protease family protein